MLKLTNFYIECDVRLSLILVTIHVKIVFIYKLKINVHDMRSYGGNVNNAQKGFSCDTLKKLHFIMKKN